MKILVGILLTTNLILFIISEYLYKNHMKIKKKQKRIQLKRSLTKDPLKDALHEVISKRQLRGLPVTKHDLVSAK